MPVGRLYRCLLTGGSRFVGADDDDNGSRGAVRGCEIVECGGVGGGGGGKVRGWDSGLIGGGQEVERAGKVAWRGHSPHESDVLLVLRVVRWGVVGRKWRMDRERGVGIDDEGVSFGA